MDRILRRYAKAQTAEVEARRCLTRAEHELAALERAATLRQLTLDPKAPQWKTDLMAQDALSRDGKYNDLSERVSMLRYEHDKAKARLRVVEAGLLLRDPVQERRQRILEKIAELVREERCRE